LWELARSCNKTESTKGGLAHGFGGEQIFFRLPVSAVGMPMGEVCPDGWVVDGKSSACWAGERWQSLILT